MIKVVVATVILAAISNVVVYGALTRCALLRSMCGLKNHTDDRPTLWYIYNVSVDMSSGYLQVFLVELGSLHRTCAVRIEYLK